MSKRLIKIFAIVMQSDYIEVKQEMETNLVIMPTILKGNIEQNYCKMRATKEEIIQHFQENKSEHGSIQLYDTRNDRITDFGIDNFKNSKEGEYDFYLYLSELGNVIHIII